MQLSAIFCLPLARSSSESAIAYTNFQYLGNNKNSIKMRYTTPSWASIIKIGLKALLLLPFTHNIPDTALAFIPAKYLTSS